MIEYEYCRDLVERFDPDRYLCSLFAPATLRPGLMTLYAFNVEVAGIRESVTENLIGRMRLQWWIDIMDRVFDGDPPAHQVARAISKTIVKYGLDREPFDSLLEARGADFEDVPFKTLEELEVYAGQTSSTLTSLVLAVLGNTDEAVKRAGNSIGIAWALTGLLRAIPFHARQKRSFLPLELVEKSGTSLYNGEEITEIVSKISELAIEHLQLGRESRRNVTRVTSVALSHATLADGYLLDLKNSGFNPYKADLKTIRLGTKVRFLINGLVGGY